jgi:hypothetical protein
VQLKQPGHFYRIDSLELNIVTEEGVTQKKWSLRKADELISIPVTSQVTQVIIDPHFRVLHWDKDYKEEVTSLARVSLVQTERLAGRLDKADSLYKVLINTIPFPDKYGVAFGLHYEMARIHMLRGNNDSALAYFFNALKEPVRRNDLLPWAYYRIAELSKKANNSVFEWACAKAIMTDALTDNAIGMKEQIDRLKN